MPSDFGSVCDCSCHKSFGHVVHCMPCCGSCPICHKRIRAYAFDPHVKRCEAKLADDLKTCLGREATEEEKKGWRRLHGLT